MNPDLLQFFVDIVRGDLSSRLAISTNGASEFCLHAKGRHCTDEFAIRLPREGKVLILRLTIGHTRALAPGAPCSE